MKDLREFIDLLETKNELVRINHPVSAHLEITEITDRISKSPAENNSIPVTFSFVEVTDPVYPSTASSSKRAAITPAIS